MLQPWAFGFRPGSFHVVPEIVPGLSHVGSEVVPGLFQVGSKVGPGLFQARPKFVPRRFQVDSKFSFMKVSLAKKNIESSYKHHQLLLDSSSPH